MQKLVCSQNAIDLLNEIHKLDPRVLQDLVSRRVECNEALAMHPSVQVGAHQRVCYQCHGEKRFWIGTPDESDCIICKGTGVRDECVVGLLGILNGLFQNEDGTGQICVVTDDAGAIQRFDMFLLKK